MDARAPDLINRTGEVATRYIYTSSVHAMSGIGRPKDLNTVNYVTIRHPKKYRWISTLSELVHERPSAGSDWTDRWYRLCPRISGSVMQTFDVILNTVNYVTIQSPKKKTDWSGRLNWWRNNDHVLYLVTKRIPEKSLPWDCRGYRCGLVTKYSSTSYNLYKGYFLHVSILLWPKYRTYSVVRRGL